MLGSSNGSFTAGSKNETERIFIPQTIFYNFNLTCPVEDGGDVILTDIPGDKITIPSTTTQKIGEGLECAKVSFNN